MRTALLKAAALVSASFWFVPALCTIAAIAIALGLLRLDERFPKNIGEDTAWVFSGGPEGARGLLSAIASSMITVSGVTFSITVVALTLAAQQYTPRVIRQFTSDKGNQLVLGTFLGTFVYCLFVLRTVRGEGFGSVVPHFAVTGAVALSLISVALFIYFIHHVTASLRPGAIVPVVTRQTEEMIDRLFPERLGSNPAPSVKDALPAAPEKVMQIEATEPGYIQTVDTESLMRVAVEAGITVQMEAAIGEFVPRGGIIATAWPIEPVDRETQARIYACFGQGQDRTMQQDPEFGVIQIVDIAVRALSPGINDPTTANICMDYLGHLLVHLGGREIPSPFRLDEHGTVRVIALGTDLEKMRRLAFDSIRHYASNSPMVLSHLERTARKVEEISDRRRPRTPRANQ